MAVAAGMWRMAHMELYLNMMTHTTQVILPLAPEWEVEHQRWLEGLREKEVKPYPQEFISPKRAGAGGANAVRGFLDLRICTRVGGLVGDACQSEVLCTIHQDSRCALSAACACHRSHSNAAAGVAPLVVLVVLNPNDVTNMKPCCRNRRVSRRRCGSRRHASRLRMRPTTRGRWIGSLTSACCCCSSRQVRFPAVELSTILWRGSGCAFWSTPCSGRKVHLLTVTRLSNYGLKTACDMSPLSRTRTGGQSTNTTLDISSAGGVGGDSVRHIPFVEHQHTEMLREAAERAPAHYLLTIIIFIQLVLHPI